MIPPCNRFTTRSKRWSTLPRGKMFERPSLADAQSVSMRRNCFEIFFVLRNDSLNLAEHVPELGFFCLQILFGAVGRWNLNRNSLRHTNTRRFEGIDLVR